MTYSIAGICPVTGMIGCAIASSNIAVTSRCAFVRKGSGVVLSQNVTNPNLGTMALDYMQQGRSPDRVIQLLHQADKDIQWRQLGILNTAGDGITFSGSHCLDIQSTYVSTECLAMGNRLANDQVPDAMIEKFINSEGHLASRLMAALNAGREAGGELTPARSAGIIVCGTPLWPIVDLRVDWHIDPLNELQMIWQNYKPQIQEYINRADTPEKAEISSEFSQKI